MRLALLRGPDLVSAPGRPPRGLSARRGCLGPLQQEPWLFVPPKKTFVLPHGQGIKQVPDLKRDTRTFSSRRIAPAPGYPSEPVGNPLLAGIGPGSWAERSDKPDVTAHGDARIVPLRVAEGFGRRRLPWIRAVLPFSAATSRRPAPSRDLGRPCRTPDPLLRVELAGGARSVLLPNNFVVFQTAAAMSGISMCMPSPPPSLPMSRQRPVPNS